MPRRWKEGQPVLTEQNERATIKFLYPDQPFATLVMDDQFMPDGGAAFRNVLLETLKPTPK